MAPSIRSGARPPKNGDHISDNVCRDHELIHQARFEKCLFNLLCLHSFPGPCIAHTNAVSKKKYGDRRCAKISTIERRRKFQIGLKWAGQRSQKKLCGSDARYALETASRGCLRSCTATNTKAARPQGRGPSQVLRRYPSAFFTRSGVNGVCRSRTPVSCITAFEIAGAISGVAICPAPVGWLSVWISSTCITGTSFIRGR